MSLLMNWFFSIGDGYVFLKEDTCFLEGGGEGMVVNSFSIKLMFEKMGLEFLNYFWKNHLTVNSLASEIFST